LQSQILSRDITGKLPYDYYIENCRYPDELLINHLYFDTNFENDKN